MVQAATPQKQIILRHHNATEAQRQFWHDPARFRAMVGGVGSGKTRGGAVEVLRMPAASHGMIVAPTYPILRDTTLRTMLELCERAGIIKSFNKNEMALDLIDGKNILFRSADNPDHLRGPNIGWFWLDEAAMLKPDAWNIMIGRLRELPGRGWATTSPRGFNWFHKLFMGGGQDYSVIHASTRLNTFLPSGFVESLERTYSGAFLAQEVDGEWVDVGGVDRFLPSLTIWDGLLDSALPPHNPRQGMVLGVDGAVSGDSFAVVGVTRHPVRKSDIAVRYSREYRPDGQPLDFGLIEQDLRELKKRFHIVEIVYDPYQLHYMMTRLQSAVWCEPFNQGTKRLEADKGLLDLIMQGRLSHDGTHPALRQHLDNADRQVTGDGSNKLRIVKREANLKIDLAVALSMAAHECLDLNL